ncbi:probable isoprenylcysteine alpha-carbonyl methylesterase ICMEL2 [Medicago truncatula]|uniref:protein-S-isoprenylcysteine alpha-carbonyl methylesterase n=3 Tax=Medicago truncatula TaxID=3880 RepID=G7ZZ54_MEDTR|nr:probable isoprenylcysteine alpha-carbonyl methylesterase ICMEL2 [Medicago truncatula]KEH25292.1 isoprenylcysteine alpha-carbonyl methylesterase ICME protein [Medicago truncatula]
MKTPNNNHREKLRRLAGNNNNHRSRKRSFKRDIEHVASETYLMTRLAFTLLQYLGVGYRWITQFLALVIYAMFLLPGFLQVAYCYFFSNRVKRSIVYGDQPRNRLDLYLPADVCEPKPVLIFVTGGAWIIGYKAWGSLLGLQLAERDIMVACIDYRNFPQGTISDMVNDTCQGISFVINNIASYGGDPDRIYLMGQSAGAHISSCALLEQATRETKNGDGVSWSVSQLKAYFGLSGGYNLLDLVDHFHNRGLYRSIFLSIMEGEQSLKKFSPELKVQDPCIKDSIPLLPRIILFHGTGDYSIPSTASEKFADALKEAGASAELILYDGKTHTDLFVQDPLRGGKDDLFDHVLATVHSDDSDALAKDAMAPPRRRLVPEILLKIANNISPF